VAYPVGIDAAWLGADEIGRVGLFITAGEGPVPETALHQLELGIWPEKAVAGLPRVGPCNLLAEVPNPNSFIEAAERGIFVYDWTDIHRSRSGEMDSYELVASPTCETSLSQVRAYLGVQWPEIPVVCDSFGSMVAVCGVKA
jgi:hypothetical protein